MFSFIKSESRYKRRFHMSISLNPRQYTMRYMDAGKRATSQMPASIHTYIFQVENPFNAYVNYEHTLSTAIHHICEVCLLKQKVTTCCDLPKLTTFPLLRLQRNSAPILCRSSIPQITNSVDSYMD
jgi:hypothetical protein